MSLSTVALTALLNEADSLPKKITNDEDKGKYTDLINRLRDEAKKLDAIRDKQNDVRALFERATAAVSAIAAGNTLEIKK